LRFKPRWCTIVLLRSVLSSVLISAILHFVQVTSLGVLACVYIEVKNLWSSASSAFLSPYIYKSACVIQRTAARNRDGCTMRYNALAALRYNALSLSGKSGILSFSVSSNQAHCLCLYASRAEDSAPGEKWLLPWFILIYHSCDLITCHPTYLPFQHQLHSPESYNTLPAYHPCTVRVKSKYASVRLCRELRWVSQHRSWGWIWGSQEPRPVGSRWEEVLYLAR
jgi:hypothetical protein